MTRRGRMPGQLPVGSREYREQSLTDQLGPTLLSTLVLAIGCMSLFFQRRSQSKPRPNGSSGKAAVSRSCG